MRRACGDGRVDLRGDVEVVVARAARAGAEAHQP